MKTYRVTYGNGSGKFTSVEVQADSLTQNNDLVILTSRSNGVVLAVNLSHFLSAEVQGSSDED